MNVVFRVDASTRIGTGHVMRCLTLAQGLRDQNVECEFICREHAGHLLDLLEKEGFKTHRLAVTQKLIASSENTMAEHTNYEAWLGVSSEEDVLDCIEFIKLSHPDWLVVDHYALDASWEKALKPHVGKILVIDDLADRPHDCDLLLDQNLGSNVADYVNKVTATCKVLTGPEFALLRPEFSSHRDKSLARRKEQPFLMHILVTMGGVDPDNATGAVLEALRKSNLPKTCRISVVMGARAPWLRKIQSQAETMPYRTEVLSGIFNMAEVMTAADLAIGAAGSTSWERCCLGLPSFMFVLAENQRGAAKALEDYGCARLLGSFTDGLVVQRLNKELASLQLENALIHMINNSCSITDGRGVSRLIDVMIGE